MNSYMSVGTVLNSNWCYPEWSMGCPNSSLRKGLESPGRDQMDSG